MNSLIASYNTKMNNVNNLLLQSPLINQSILNQTANNIKHENEVKLLEKFQQIEKRLGKEKIKTLIINPEKTQEKKNEITKEVLSRFNELKKIHEPKLEEYRKTRTNQTYKGIITFDFKKPIAKQQDLVVHTVTKEDKDKLQLSNKFSEMVDNIKEHNKELETIYNKTNEQKHKNNFEYNNIYKFKVETPSADNEEIRTESIKQLKNEETPKINPVIIEEFINTPPKINIQEIKIETPKLENPKSTESPKIKLEEEETELMKMEKMLKEMMTKN